jgi:hypothetical protein
VPCAAPRCRFAPVSAFGVVRHDFVAQLRQHAGAHQLGVDFLIELFQRRQHVAIEQLVDDQLDAHVRAELAQRWRNACDRIGRRHRVAGVVDLVAAADHRQALVDGEQVARRRVRSCRSCW